MKILHVITSLNVGGAEVLLKDLVINLKRKGCAVVIIVLIKTESFLLKMLEMENVEIIHAPVNSKVSMRNLWFLWNHLRVNHYDIVHAHLTWDTYSLAMVGCFLSHKPVFIITEHSTLLKRRNNFFVKLFRLEQWLYSKYNKIICINNEVYNSITSQIFGVKKKCVLIQSGVDIKRFSAEYLLKERMDKSVILNIGTLCKGKQQEVLIRAITRLPFVVELWLVGEGPDRIFLDNLTKELKLERQVRFLGVQSDTADLIKQATIYVQPSLYEGLSIAMLEAMAGGLPMVASNAPGMHELVDEIGVFFEIGNWKQLGELLFRLLQDSLSLLNMSNASKNKSKQFSIEYTADAYLKLYAKEMVRS